eukprot:SAG11_NODE_22933_length_397_cov_22.590604_1_plen_78_part_00
MPRYSVRSTPPCICHIQGILLGRLKVDLVRRLPKLDSGLHRRARVWRTPAVAGVRRNCVDGLVGTRVTAVSADLANI